MCHGSLCHDMNMRYDHDMKQDENEYKILQVFSVYADVFHY